MLLGCCSLDPFERPLGEGVDADGFDVATGEIADILADASVGIRCSPLDLLKQSNLEIHTDNHRLLSGLYFPASHAVSFYIVSP